MCMWLTVIILINNKKKKMKKWRILFVELSRYISYLYIITHLSKSHPFYKWHKLTLSLDYWRGDDQ